ncbi:hypothetical protein [Brevibacterium atlanticum]|uniref:hypothetical protein n=1 Tax=Brevibacterium atlanticum TaxID=2697563 RepID=UPI001421F724|nr:hypothetical protein [Brevibacterium atlanticum]
MTPILLTVGGRPQFVDGTHDPRLAEAAGPAVLLDVDSVAEDDSNSSPGPDSDTNPEAPSLSDCISAPNRPLAYREAGADWTDIDFEAADHWVQMGPALRRRLGEDHLATLDVSEFKVATNGGSASIITNNWVHSGSPRVYRVAGRLREFVTTLGELASNR